MIYVYIFVYSSIIGSFLHVFAQNFPQQNHSYFVGHTVIIAKSHYLITK
ncbi:Uncharacterised protein [Listeria fleischmannii subsp. fleischmannii]|uniref:Uncharacterized protein n=1 Tax=Listeria fleischmannii subsp. fleischmannii TaxID=1671902 RepID=A0A2X3J9C2_9LIST|nr:Uncharacterised protein [Listeria fleischmannii subsp. fleischmannii]